MKNPKSEFDQLWELYRNDPSPTQSFKSFLWWNEYKNNISQSLQSSYGNY